MLTITEIHEAKNLCEVVDEQNRLLAILSKDDASKQKLITRQVGLILKDLSSHGLFRLNPDGSLTLTYKDYLPVGQAESAFAEDILKDKFQTQTNHIVNLAQIGPSKTCREFITVLGLVISGSKLKDKANNDKNYLWLSQAEFLGLYPQLTPKADLLNYLYEQKILSNFLGWNFANQNLN